MTSVGIALLLLPIPFAMLATLVGIPITQNHQLTLEGIGLVFGALIPAIWLISRSAQCRGCKRLLTEASRGSGACKSCGRRLEA